jgi:hypothetical protein
LDIHINTTFEKTIWSFSFFKLNENVLIAKYSNEIISLIELLGDLKVVDV